MGGLGGRAARLGSASGLVNVGGFVASLLTMLAVGVVLDLLTAGGTDYALGSFRAAFALQYVVWALGTWQVVRYRRLLRRRLAEGGVVLAPLHRAVSVRLWGSSAYLT